MNTQTAFVRLSVLALAAFLTAGCESDSGRGGGGAVPSFLLQVTKAGSGQGTVTSDIPGINCGPDCAQNLVRGTTVELTAVASPGSSLVGWSEAGCSGATCTVSVNDDLAVTVTFSLNTAPGTLGEVVALNSLGELLSFNRDTPNTIQTRAAVTLGAGETLVEIDYRPANNVLFGLVKGTLTSRLVTLDAVSGAITGTVNLSADSADATSPYTNLGGTEFGMDFNPSADRIRVVSDAMENLRIHPETGKVTTDTNLSGAVTAASAAAYTSNFKNAPGTVLMLVEADKLLIQNPPNDGTTQLVDNLHGDESDLGAVLGFDIVTADLQHTGYLAGTDPGGNTELYSVDLFTGTLTLEGAIGVGNEPIRGLAITPGNEQKARGNALVLTNDNRLVSFDLPADLSTPPTSVEFKTAVNVLGLRSGEQAIGIDHRPVDGVLYTVGNLAGNARLYTVDPASGFATNVATLVVDPADATAPTYTSLSGATFGMSFKPTNDRIRIVTSTGQNLTVKVHPGSEGLVTQDPNLTDNASPNFPQPRIVQPATANAFSDALAGVGATTHYAIDTAGDLLTTVRETANIANPNDDPAGELTDVGGLGVDVSSVNGFDIDPMTATAFAAFKVDSQSPPNGLYTVNLTNGSATKLSNLGTGLVDIKGLSLVPPTGPILYGAVTDGGMQKLVKFSPTYPGTFRAFTQVTGSPDRVTITTDGSTPLAGTVIGLDFRRLGGAPDLLYALVQEGTSDKVYLVNRETGVATLQNTLAASPDDPTNPYVGPIGGNVDVDFDQLASLSVASLRVGTSTDLNLRANVTSTPTGETFSDSTFSQLPPQGGIVITGVAYPAEDGVSPVLRSTLYVIDQDGGDDQGRLGRLTAPAGGSVTHVDPSIQLVDPVLDGLTIVQGSKGMFDIAGPRNLLPFAALKVGDSPNAASNIANTLFRVSLTGATAAPVGAIGDGSLDLNGMTIHFEPLGN